MLSYAGNPERFHEVNERFHNAIYAGSQNGYIAEMTLATRVRVQPFRRAQFRNLGRLAKSHAEHDRVVVAILRGDRPARPPRCAPTSNWCAANMRSTRCRCDPSFRGAPLPSPLAGEGGSYRRYETGEGCGACLWLPFIRRGLRPRHLSPARGEGKEVAHPGMTE